MVELRVWKLAFEFLLGDFFPCGPNGHGLGKGKSSAADEWYKGKDCAELDGQHEIPTFTRASADIGRCGRIISCKNASVPGRNSMQARRQFHFQEGAVFEGDLVVVDFDRLTKQSLVAGPGQYEAKRIGGAFRVQFFRCEGTAAGGQEE